MRLKAGSAALPASTEIQQHPLVGATCDRRNRRSLCVGRLEWNRFPLSGVSSPCVGSAAGNPETLKIAAEAVVGLVVASAAFRSDSQLEAVRVAGPAVLGSSAL